MPELPTIEIYKHYFDSTSLHQRIKKVEIRNPEILVNTTSTQLHKALVGQQFISTRRYGKYLFCRLKNSQFLILHFGMTGYLKYFQGEGPPHIRLLISFQNGHHLAFDDMRKFGKVGLTPDPDKFIENRRLGPDALAIRFKTFKKIFENRKGAIKPLIMNQNFLAGIGNLYADEILYQSRIHPLNKADKLDKDDLERLFREMRQVLIKAIEYQDQPHTLPSSFLLPHRYQGGECPDGGEIGIIKVGGRTTYFCPKQQKMKTS
jgi:formamidopyrimidine-DNA glycosylase